MLSLKKSKEKIYIHIIVWTIFIIYELSYIYLLTGQLGKWEDLAIHYSLNITLLYTNTYLLALVYPKKRWQLYIAVIIILEIGIYLVFHFLIVYFLAFFNIAKPDLSNLRLTIIQEVYRAIYFIGISTGYWFALSIMRQKKMIDELHTSKIFQEKASIELEKNLMKAKTAYLQSQLNPHLLFNTLNFIYNSVRKISESSAYAILLLAEMMRYSLSNVGDDGKVSLQKEIDHIFNLVKINQLRFNEKLNLKVDINGEFEDTTIIPLLLLTFVENIYKHGDLTDPLFPGEIIINCEDHYLTMKCSNKKKKSIVNKGWGIGIENANTRLEIYYPNKHNIQITNTNEGFSLELKVHLE